MMTTAYFDCYNGISGDMTLGALVDLGVRIEALRAALAALPITSYKIETERVKRCGIGATLVRVIAGEHHAHRGFSEIRDIIANSAFSDAVKHQAIKAFHKLATAEAEIHETSMEKVRFHEVGAIDAIVDITGAMWGLEQLGVGRVIASSVCVGSGTVNTAHGIMPIPAPATAKLLEGTPISAGPMDGELTTPTGAAILTTITSEFKPLPEFMISRTGYGAGSRERKGHTNYLRVMLGEEKDAETRAPVEKRELAIVQTEIDDMPGQLFGHLLEMLLAEGCLDAHIRPIQMKKNRPGVSIQALVEPGHINRIVELMLRETATFGVKVLHCDRYCLRRAFQKIQTPYGEVSVKLGYWGDDVLKAMPEYEDCRHLAHEKRVPLIEVLNAARTAADLCFHPKS
ncbi:MAG: nickel pincer cofactor biosynthesis protein LarC [Candidatus Sumerlaeota bacterium]|nr:nickel pincer cofactor biosynthesis protein LarC [Candidatus Sumerlaeota bacterium]